MRELGARGSAHHSRLVAGALCALLLTTFFAITNPVHASAADSGAEAQFVSALNGIRSSHGLPPLRVYGELTGIARAWTDQMVANGGISHNPDLASEVTANWTKLGENVGVGPDVQSLMNAFVNSPAHYRNIVDPSFNYVGVGVSYDSAGRMYTTHDFMRLDDASPPAAAPDPDPAPAPEPAPAPSQEPVASAPDAASAPAAAPAPTELPPAAPARVHAVLTALRVGDI